MPYAKLMPLSLIALDVLASIGYGATGDVRRAIYWAAAAILTTTVTF